MPLPPSQPVDDFLMKLSNVYALHYLKAVNAAHILSHSHNYYFLSESNGCKLSLEQKICLSIQGVVALVQGLSCEHASVCEKNFKKVAAAAKGACDISLTFLCDDESCPENHNKSTCKTRRVNDFWHPMNLFMLSMWVSIKTFVNLLILVYILAL